LIRGHLKKGTELWVGLTNKKNEGLNSFITRFTEGIQGTTQEETLFTDFLTTLAHPHGGAG
jgi:hypothetical protein